MKLVDTTYGVCAEARAVLVLLEDRTPEFAYKGEGFYDVLSTTQPWYNGREKGFVISMKIASNISMPWIHIACFEHRNSDAICLLKWETEISYWNHPLEDPNIFEKAYGGAEKTKWDVYKKFRYNEISECAFFIYNELETFYNRFKVEEEGE